MKRLIIFDLDGTLAESKSALDTEMAGLLTQLLNVVPVAVISGGAFPQFEQQLLSKLAGASLQRLSILPTCGTKFYRYEGGWRILYAEEFSAEQKAEIVAALQHVTHAPGMATPRTWGDQIEDRGSQITFSALGQEAPLEEKKKWDPDFKKRKQMQAALAPLLPGFSVRLGGTTSIDVTKPGIDKAYGVRKLRDTLAVAISDMLFIGDALFPGGNDYPAKEAGAPCIQVRDPSETKRVIEAMVACLTG
ncbi:MAG: HAD-IIB family hydrolase [Pseudomonadota bacterium]